MPSYPKIKAMNALSIYSKLTVYLEINRAKNKHPSARCHNQHSDRNTIVSVVIALITLAIYLEKLTSKQILF